MKKIVTGFVAHVDAGKTTLTESMLYLSGALRRQGRVDKQSSFLDYDAQERERGITIYAKVSAFDYKDTHFTFIDTPGHIDFSGEMERALTAMDNAVLIISGNDGVQSHTRTIWKLLNDYQVPTFVFVNKMDISPLEKAKLMDDLHALSANIVSLDDREALAMCDDQLLEAFMAEGISDSDITRAIKARHVFPAVFGSALKNEGVAELMDLMDRYSVERQDQKLSGIVFKITHEEHERLSFVRLSGGRVHVKDTFLGEKINQIRVYNGAKYTLAKEAGAGDVVALTGLKDTFAGECFGDYHVIAHELEPFMHYSLHINDEHKTQMLAHLKALGEEEPLLNLKIRDGDHIEVSLMGEVQIEILKQMIKERYGADVTIDSRQVSYRETIIQPVEGVGHFEPLRHYAEVHLYLEPLPRGSGLEFVNRCDPSLAAHYQRLIMTHLEEKEHLGVLTGSPITDLRITLLGGRAHEKHTEGGDFRQATYRAVRQGLMNTESILLEPYEHYEITLPNASVSKLFYDLDDYGAPEMVNDDGQMTTLKGTAPVSFLYDYQTALLNYTKGEGVIHLSDPYYDVCHNSEEVMMNSLYDPAEDLENPTGSIFCSHGAGFYVPYDQVYDYMHLPLYSQKKTISETAHTKYHVSDEEAKRVYESIYGKQERKLAKDFYGTKKAEKQPAETHKNKPVCLLVDGYNVIFSWDELKERAADNLGAARDALIDLMVSYQGYKGYTLILVFDAYQVPGNPGEVREYHNIYIVYTKEAQTADAYIEKATKHLAKDYQVIVATSDSLEQKIVIGHGAARISSRELKKDLELTNQQETSEFNRKNPIMHNTVMEDSFKK